MTHRDLGYFFVGMVLIYAISGIAINHKEVWNPSYIISVEYFETEAISKSEIDKEYVLRLLSQIDENMMYKNHYFPKSDLLKIFVPDGIVAVNLDSGEGSIEINKKRPFFNQVNFLHYDPGKWWTWFSDIFCVALAFLSISGLFILKGKNGLKWRGAILAGVGIIIPLIFLFILR